MFISYLHTYNVMDPPSAPNAPPSSLRDSKGWDGKLRLDKKAVITNAEVLSDPEYSDEDALPVEQISADEGKFSLAVSLGSLISCRGRSARRL